MTAPKGFRFAVANAGFRKQDRNDVGLVVSDTPAVSAGVFTQAAFRSAPVQVGQELIAQHQTTRAVLINSGQANACTGDQGLVNCRKTQELVAKATGLKAEEILPASTGVIGNQLLMDKWELAAPVLVNGLGKAGTEDFAKAIMTTDSFPKWGEQTVTLSGGEVRLAGMAKGAGMICPNMATMLAVVLCDAAVPVDAWRAMFRRAVDLTFNRVTVDGDTSPNDTIYGLANGASGVTATGNDLALLEEALTKILGDIAYMLVKDGEGATKVIHIAVTGAKDNADAEKVARTVGHSQLVKTAMYGKDANWGRIVAAMGRSGAAIKPEEASVSLCGVTIFSKGQPVPGDHDAALKAPMAERDIRMDISLGTGAGAYTLLASDLTHEYVSINADYRS